VLDLAGAGGLVVDDAGPVADLEPDDLVADLRPV
jgi:hypothetical protein